LESRYEKNPACFELRGGACVSTRWSKTANRHSVCTREARWQNRDPVRRFNYETVMRLRKMKVNCDGFKDKFKDACVSIEVMLHCPGTQVNYVKQVTLQVVFENKDLGPLPPARSKRIGSRD
jgi:hypothetical protein